ncbi:MAG: RNA methyltransferase, partial [Lachnospiraceae bacterium]|nr:RNA methyltransferase [Lachnospiraceae bacterium]
AATSAELSGWLKEVSAAGVFVETVSEEVCRRMSEVVHSQGVVAVVRMPESGEGLVGAEDLRGTGISGSNLAEDLRGSNVPLLVFLENLQDPGNMGTILRTAEAAGATGVAALGNCVDLYSPKVVRSTMGSIFRLPHRAYPDGGEALRAARQAGICLYGAMLSEDSVPYEEADFTRSCAVLIGNEGAGLSQEAAALCDAKISIPMQGKVESLNAGMAAGILLFEAARQRRRPEK